MFPGVMLRFNIIWFGPSILIGDNSSGVTFSGRIYFLPCGPYASKYSSSCKDVTIGFTLLKTSKLGSILPLTIELYINNCGELVGLPTWFMVCPPKELTRLIIELSNRKSPAVLIPPDNILLLMIICEFSL